MLLGEEDENVSLDIVFWALGIGIGVGPGSCGLLYGVSVRFSLGLAWAKGPDRNDSES